MPLASYKHTATCSLRSQHTMLSTELKRSATCSSSSSSNGGGGGGGGPAAYQWVSQVSGHVPSTVLTHSFCLIQADAPRHAIQYRTSCHYSLTHSPWAMLRSGQVGSSCSWCYPLILPTPTNDSSILQCMLQTLSMKFALCMLFFTLITAAFHWLSSA